MKLSFLDKINLVLIVIGILLLAILYREIQSRKPQPGVAPRNMIYQAEYMDLFVRLPA